MCSRWWNKNLSSNITHIFQHKKAQRGEKSFHFVGCVWLCSSVRQCKSMNPAKNTSACSTSASNYPNEWLFKLYETLSPKLSQWQKNKMIIDWFATSLGIAVSLFLPTFFVESFSLWKWKSTLGSNLLSYRLVFFPWFGISNFLFKIIHLRLK